MADRLAGFRTSVRVISKTSGKKIMVERAMYCNSRGAGTDTLGGSLSSAYVPAPRGNGGGGMGARGLPGTRAGTDTIGGYGD